MKDWFDVVPLEEILRLLFCCLSIFLDNVDQVNVLWYVIPSTWRWRRITTLDLPILEKLMALLCFEHITSKVLIDKHRSCNPPENQDKHVFFLDIVYDSLVLHNVHFARDKLLDSNTSRTDSCDTPVNSATVPRGVVPACFALIFCTEPVPSNYCTKGCTYTQLTLLSKFFTLIAVTVYKVFFLACFSVHSEIVF